MSNLFHDHNGQLLKKARQATTKRKPPDNIELEGDKKFRAVVQAAGGGNSIPDQLRKELSESMIAKVSS